MTIHTFFLNMLTGEAEGEFDLLKVRDSNGDMINILSLLSGVGIINSAQQPLSISNGVLSIDLSTHVTNTALTNALALYTVTTNLNI